MAIYSPMTLSASALGALFQYGWNTASQQMARMSSLSSPVQLTLSGPSGPSLPAVTQEDINLLGEQYLQGEVGNPSLDADAVARRVGEELRARFERSAREWEAIFASLMQQVLPLGNSYDDAIRWLLDENGPYLGDVGRAQRVQQIGEFAIGGSAVDELGAIGIPIPASAVSPLRQVSASGVAANASGALAGMSLFDRNLKARHLGDGTEAILSAWWRANDIVRDHLLDQIRAQFDGVDGPSSLLNQLRLNNMADMAALRLERGDTELHSTRMGDALAESSDRSRRYESRNQRRREIKSMSVSDYVKRVGMAAAQARAALNSNGLSVNAGFSERRNIDME